MTVSPTEAGFSNVPLGGVVVLGVGVGVGFGVVIGVVAGVKRCWGGRGDLLRRFCPLYFYL